MKHIVFMIAFLVALVFAGCGNLANDSGSTSSTDMNDAAPTGTYTGESLGIKGTVNFQGNKVTFYNPIDGKIIYEYALMKDGVLCYPGKVTAPNSEGTANQILLRDHAMGTQRTASFKYLPGDRCVVIDGQRYYK